MVLRSTSHFSDITSRLYNCVSSRYFLRDTISTTVLSVVGKGVGFLIPFFIAAWFGISDETDAFFFAYGLLLFLTGIFAPVMESVVVPFIVEIKSRGEEEVQTFLGTTLLLATAGLTLLGCLVIAISRPLLGFVTSFSEESLGLIVQLFIEIIPLLVLLVGTSLLSGTLNAYKLFWFPAISPAFRAVVALLLSLF